MHRRIALATVACALALPASALAAEPAATGAGGVGLKPASGLKVTSLKASKSGRTVTAKVRWDRALIVRKAERERFTVRLLSGPAGQRRVLGTVSRRAPKGTSENVRFRLNARNARRVKSSSRVFATATQQFDSPDTDRLYELNHVSIASMKGKRPFASAAASSCPTEIKPNTDMTGCQLPGANLAGADLSKVIFYQANLEVSNLAGADLSSTDLTQADLTGASLVGAKTNSGEQSAFTFPDDGPKIEDLIDSAKTSVDVVIYSFGGPNIVGQASNPGALMRAVSRGVNVRVLVNSGGAGCDTAEKDPGQAKCAGSPSRDGFYATEASLKAAAQDAVKNGKTPGKYRVQFSSENYQITHQKSILIDTSDDKGNPLNADQLAKVPTATVMVSTGNLQSYTWGAYSKCATKNEDKRVYIAPDNCLEYVQSSPASAKYLSDPAATCKGGPSECPAEWAARDFAIKVTDPTLMARIAAVYDADQTCKDWNASTTIQGLLNSDLADTWANGTLVSGGAGYPPAGSSSFYGSGPNPLLQTQPQGNSRERQLALIASAKQTLTVYNEEMADAEIASALVKAAGNGVSVRVVMASTFDKQTGKPVPTGEAFSYNPKTGVKTRAPYPTAFFSFLVANKVQVRFLNSDGPLYIHGKAIVADGVNAFMGSENFGYESLNYNRELGLMLTNSTRTDVVPKWPTVLSVGGIAAIMTAFSNDWNSSGAVQWAVDDFDWKTDTNPEGTQNKPYETWPTPPYPQDTYHKMFPGVNMSCLTDPGGNRYAPALPTRTLPPTS